MKKIAIVLLMALALVSIATAEVVVSGEFEYGFMANAAEFAGEFDKLELDFNGDIDEFNSFSMELEANNKLENVNGQPVLVNWATVTTDWAAILDLPIGVSTTVGTDGFGIGDSYYASGVGLENVNGGIWLNNEAAGKLEIVPSEILTAFVAANFHQAKDGADNEIMVGATVDVDPVSVLVGYDTTAGGTFYSEVMFGTELGGGMTLDVAGSIWYDMDYTTVDELAGDPEMKFGAGVGFGVAGAVLGVSFNGNDTDALGNLGFDLNYGLTEEVSADFGAKYDMVESELKGMDFSVAYAAGAVSYRLGYVVTDGFGWDYKAEAAVKDGGAYFNVQLDF